MLNSSTEHQLRIPLSAQNEILNQTDLELFPPFFVFFCRRAFHLSGISDTLNSISIIDYVLSRMK